MDPVVSYSFPNLVTLQNLVALCPTMSVHVDHPKNVWAGARPLKLRGIFDRKNVPLPFMGYYAEFGRSTLKSMNIVRGVKTILSKLGPRPLRWCVTGCSTSSTWVSMPNLMAVQSINQSTFVKRHKSRANRRRVYGDSPEILRIASRLSRSARSSEGTRIDPIPMTSY